MRDNKIGGLLDKASSPVNARAKPFVKWAGGKRALIQSILQLVPDDITNYHEPFLGGGALFYALEQHIKKAFLSDANCRLMTTYQAIQKDVKKVISLLKIHDEKHDKHYFSSMRKREDSDMFEDAAKFIYLNRTCFNGLYRVNSKNEFNVSMGAYKNPQICDADNLHQVSEALQKAKLTSQEFQETEPSAGDFIYCDPPYDGAYAGYTPLRFNDREQELLAQRAQEWHAAGATVVISNSNTPLIRKLYPKEKWRVIELHAPRTISCNGNDRKPVVELLITNT